jgi:hypothetical protein
LSRHADLIWLPGPISSHIHVATPSLLSPALPTHHNRAGSSSLRCSGFTGLSSCQSARRPPCRVNHCLSSLYLPHICCLLVVVSRRHVAFPSADLQTLTQPTNLRRSPEAGGMTGMVDPVQDSHPRALLISETNAPFTRLSPLLELNSHLPNLATVSLLAGKTPGLHRPIHSFDSCECSRRSPLADFYTECDQQICSHLSDTGSRPYMSQVNVHNLPCTRPHLTCSNRSLFRGTLISLPGDILQSLPFINFDPLRELLIALSGGRAEDLTSHSER